MESAGWRTSSPAEPCRFPAIGNPASDPSNLKALRDHNLCCLHPATRYNKETR